MESMDLMATIATGQRESCDLLNKANGFGSEKYLVSSNRFAKMENISSIVSLLNARENCGLTLEIVSLCSRDDLQPDIVSPGF